ncbi:Nif3-like dinuclear metal center hexameric protein [Nocardioides sp.]|uniref:Nif3-like dinuclear metal center hexameric protein n=1 Tax=Nocardioides sp. TaxID=35761 RepID=UPI003D0BD9BA
MPTLSEVVDLLHSWYPPATAEAWDAVGLVYGDQQAQVRRVMFAVDPTEEVAQEAVSWGADLLVVHHPLFLRPVHGFTTATPKGRTLATLVAGGCALLTAHTNADQAEGGVSESLALALGLTDLSPIRAAEATPRDKIVVHVPHDDAPAIRGALAHAGAGAIGDYDQGSYTSTGLGRFRPLPGANPTIGQVGEPEIVSESRIEAVLPRSLRAQVVRALLAVHPYEEPAYDVVELADPGSAPVGTGRVGQITETTLADFAAMVARVLPATAHGVRVAGDPERLVRRVAVCGGAGDFLLDDLAGTDIDAYVTSDLRHHPAGEFLEKAGPALLDVAHWAGEWLWLPAVQARITAALGDTVETRVSTLPTDPWTMRI